jgi:predicted permease
MHAVLLSFALIIALGLLWRWRQPDAATVETVRASIHTLVFTICLPALCLQVLSRTPLTAGLLRVPLVAAVSIVGGMVLAMAVYGVLSRRGRVGPRAAGALVLAATFGNVTYLGLPVLTERFGADGAAYAILFDLFASTPLLWLVGVGVAGHYGAGKPFALLEALRTLIALPPIWGCAAGVVLAQGGWTLPVAVQQAIALLAAPVVPLMVFSIGLALQRPRWDRLLVLLPAVGIKLAVVPALAFLAGRALGLTDTLLAACTLEGAMPTMVLALIIARRFGLDEGLTALTIAVTTACSVVTLPLVDHWLLAVVT